MTKILSLAVSLGLVVLACSPASVGAGDASNPDLVKACKDYAYARCVRLQGCSQAAITVNWRDVGTCQDYYRTACNVAATAPGTATTLGHLQSCTSAIANWSCTDIIYSENVPPDCTPGSGSLAMGATCANAAQCQSSWCQRPAGAACGVCAMVPGPGAPCASNDQCPQGLTCQAGACVAHSKMGGACGASHPCDDGLNCVGNVCVAGPSTMGAPCSPAGAGCNQWAGMACNASTDTCQTLKLVQPGEACGGQVANQPQYCAGGTCERGACVGYPALDEPCDRVAGPPCLAFAVCIPTVDGGTAGTCRVPGDACH